MTRVLILIILFTVVVASPRNSSAQPAHPVFKNWSTPIGVCGQKVIFYGEDKPRVHSGLYWTDGKVVRLIRDFFDSNIILSNPWQKLPQEPPLVGAVPLRLFQGRTHSLATACATARSIRTFRRGFYPEFHQNYVIRNNRIHFGEVTKTSTKIMEISASRVRTLGAAPSKQPQDDSDSGDPFTRLFNTRAGVVFQVADAITSRQTLWISDTTGTKPLSYLSDLMTEGYTPLGIGHMIESGDSKVFFSTSSRAPSGAEHTHYYVTDGEKTQRITSLPTTGRIQDIYRLRTIDGAVAVIYDNYQPTTPCRLGLISFVDRSYRDITSALGDSASPTTWCYDIAAQTSNASLFFTLNTHRNTLKRLNLRSLQLTSLITANTPIRNPRFFSGLMYFDVESSSQSWGLYVSDGTQEGTSGITIANRPFIGSNVAIELDGYVYATGYSRTNGENILDYGLYRFRVDKQISE